MDRDQDYSLFLEPEIIPQGEGNTWVGFRQVVEWRTVAHLLKIPAPFLSKSGFDELSSVNLNHFSSLNNVYLMVVCMCTLECSWGQLLTVSAQLALNTHTNFSVRICFA